MGSTRKKTTDTGTLTENYALINLSVSVLGQTERKESWERQRFFFFFFLKSITLSVLNLVLKSTLLNFKEDCNERMSM